MYRVIATFNKKIEASETLRELLDRGYGLSDIAIILRSKKKILMDDMLAYDSVMLKLSRLGVAGDIADNYNKQIENGSVLLGVPVEDEQERGMVTVLFDDYNAREIRTVGDFKFSRLLIRR